MNKKKVYLIFLLTERSWVEQGHKVGELVVPLARSFHNVTVDLESGGNDVVCQFYICVSSGILVTKGPQRP